MEDHQSIDQISKQIAEKDEKLARLFNDFISRVIQETERNQKSVMSKPFKLRVEDVIDPTSEDRNINVIPGDFSPSCQSFCVCFAFDKWQSIKGFKGIAIKVIDYWSSCSKINRGTLIFSYAWDDVDFNEKYKKRFDQYTQDVPRHTVAVILISSICISLQYLSN